MDEAQSEPATPRKLARARAEGFVARAPALSTAAALLACFAVLSGLGARSLALLERLLLASLRAAVDADLARARETLFEPLAELAALVFAVLFAIALAAALAGFLQVGPLFTMRALAPDPRRLDPFARLRALGSGASLQMLAFATLASFALLFVIAYTFGEAARGVLALGRGDANHAWVALFAVARALALRVGGALALLGAIELVLRRLQLREKLRMSRRELAREQREQYGLPEQRERRRRNYEEARAQAELSALESCSLLLLDPSRGRVLGLQFDIDDREQRAPRVMLKAQAALALRVQARAAVLGVPVFFEPNLCARLFALELSEEIPRAEYDAVAPLFRFERAAS